MLSYVSIKVNSSLCSMLQSQITGILIYYIAQSTTYNFESRSYFNIVHYHYEIIKSCSNYLQYTLTILLFELLHDLVEISVKKTMFTKLNNSCVLFFYEEILRRRCPSTPNTISILTIHRCTISKSKAKNNFILCITLEKAILQYTLAEYLSANCILLTVHLKIIIWKQ